MPQIQSNGIALEYERFGDPEHPAILLIMGLGAQMILWPDRFCERLAAAGYQVLRFDNRDIGCSAKLDHLGRPDLMRAGLAFSLGLPVRAPYGLEDMARDTVGLLDALGIARAHVVGLSMGGMIAQLLALQHRERVLSLTSIMSHSGNRRLPQPGLRLRLRLVRRPEGSGREAMIDHAMRTWQIIGSPDFPTPEPELRALMTRAYDRSFFPRGLARQTAAVMSARNRVPALRRLELPTLVIHGDRDPLIPVPAAHELARTIPGAQLEIIRGMGHDLPAALQPRIAERILGHLARV